jgi:chromosome segregation ATPase
MSGDITEKLPEGPLAEILKELRRMNERLGAVEEKVDQRQFDTKPIWERALSEIADMRAEMREQLGAISGRLDGVDGRLDRIEAEFRQLNRRFRVLGEDIVAVRGDLQEVDLRLARLEDLAGNQGSAQ